MFRRLAPSSTESDNGADYSLSISDLMAGLLIVFILVLSYYILTYSQKTERLTDNSRVRSEILQIIERELRAQGFLDVRIDPIHGVLRLPEGILFDSGSADIKEGGAHLIGTLGPVLAEVLTMPDYQGRVETIFVEGHTDSIPIHNSPRFASNWELSTQRAINSWNALQQAERRLVTLENEGGEPIFSCSGYADSRPIEDNSDAESRRRNRRIDLRFSMTPPRPEDDRPVVRLLRNELGE